MSDTNNATDTSTSSPDKIFILTTDHYAAEATSAAVVEVLDRPRFVLQCVLDGLSANIAVLDDQGYILLVNKSWREFALQNGLRPENVSEGTNYIQACVTAFGTCDDAAPFAEGIRMVLAGERNVFQLEYPCDSPHKKRWFVGRVTLFPGDGPHRVIVAHEDITERKQAEEALRESEERYRAFFISGEAIKLIIDPATGAIEDANPAAVEFYGYALDQLQGMLICELDSMPKMECLALFAENSPFEVWHHFLRHRLASGDFRDVEVFTKPIHLQGKALLMTTIHDVTELRRLERIKEGVERIVQHDLKAPLVGLITVPQLLLHDENLTADQRELIGWIEASGKKMLLQINSSLELLKIKSGTYHFDAQECDPASLVRNCIDLISKGMGIERECIIIREHATESDANLRALRTHALLLEIIMMNILRNALEAGDTSKHVFVDLFQTVNYFTLSISNSRSVPVNIRDRFFEEYVTEGKSGGTGLGTYSAAFMTRALGGTIEMETSEESGTKVTVKIPMHSA